MDLKKRKNINDITLTDVGKSILQAPAKEAKPVSLDNNGIMLYGATGAQGPRGPAGEQGPEGPPGPQGLEGPQGPPGRTGATGPTGPAGKQGPQGEQGLQGVTGPRGDVGERGYQGPQGEKGDAGPQGPQGEKGDVGPAGKDGEVGPAGPVGPQGPEGPVGPQGPVGPEGPQGPTGANGPNVNVLSFSYNGFPVSGGETFNVWMACPYGYTKVVGFDLLLRSNSGTVKAELFEQNTQNSVIKSDGLLVDNVTPENSNLVRFTNSNLDIPVSFDTAFVTITNSSDNQGSQLYLYSMNMYWST